MDGSRIPRERRTFAIGKSKSLFNLVGTGGFVNLQRRYMAVLLRILGAVVHGNTLRQLPRQRVQGKVTGHKGTPMDTISMSIGVTSRCGQDSERERGLRAVFGG